MLDMCLLKWYQLPYPDPHLSNPDHFQEFLSDPYETLNEEEMPKENKKY